MAVPAFCPGLDSLLLSSDLTPDLLGPAAAAAATRGLPSALLDAFPDERRLRIPMRPANRSLNLSNAVAVVVMEAWRQQGFAGGD